MNSVHILTLHEEKSMKTNRIDCTNINTLELIFL